MTAHTSGCRARGRRVPSAHRPFRWIRRFVLMLLLGIVGSLVHTLVGREAAASSSAIPTASLVGTHYPLLDALGSVRGLTDPQGDWP